MVTHMPGGFQYRALLDARSRADCPEIRPVASLGFFVLSTCPKPAPRSADGDRDRRVRYCGSRKPGLIGLRCATRRAGAISHRRTAHAIAMIQILEMQKSDRLLVLAPHPDDETLATGNLIQSALAAGARVRVIVATDGDDNPWPQRWLEKRWRIDAEARQRWGARRRGEAGQALAKLGVAAQDTRYFGWPDQGLTEFLMRGAQGEDQLVAELLQFAPTVIAAPSLDDLHPDHNALRVMLELALGRTPHAGCQRLGYVVHGRLPGGHRAMPDMGAHFAPTKRSALQAHLSQLVLSRRRMSRLCARTETFVIDEIPATDDVGMQEVTCRMPISSSPLRLRSRAVYVIAVVAGKAVRLKLPMPRKGAIAQAEAVVSGKIPLRLAVRRDGDELVLALRCADPIGKVFIKNERLGARIFIYDECGWLQR